MMARLVTLMCLCALWLAPHAHAQTYVEPIVDSEESYATVAVENTVAQPEHTGSDSDAATTLFVEGRALFKADKLAEACRVFERSRQLNTTVAVLLNLGLCHQRLDQLATAHVYYRRAEVLATLNGDGRGELAHQEAAKLAKRRATLALQISETSEQIEVRVDGVLQPEHSWSRPMFIDAGQHTISVHSAGRVRWQDSVSIRDELQHVVIVRDLLHAQQPTAAEPSPEPAPPALRPAAHVESDAGLGTARIVALGVGAAGIATLATGLLFGVAAQDAFSDSHAYCDAADQCRAPGIALRQDASAHATRATVLSSVGVIALASGVILWLTAPKPEQRPSALARESSGGPARQSRN